MTQENKARDRRFVVDEGISPEIFEKFETFAKAKNLWIPQHLLIRDSHPGIPDADILYHLLDENTLFLTKDRPMHNTVLSKNLCSWFANDHGFTDRPLKGIHVKPDNLLAIRYTELKNSYLPEKVEIRPLLLPESEKKLKKLRVKRRRIRAHFGGQDRLSEVAVTLSCKQLKSKTLIGIRIRISSHTTGIKAFDASESYIEETVSSKEFELVAYSHVLILLILLMLHRLTVRVYFNIEMRDPTEIATEHPNSGYAQLFHALRDCFPSLEFIPTAKGELLERLRKKLNHLSRKQTNEILLGEIKQIKERVIGE